MFNFNRNKLTVLLNVGNNEMFVPIFKNTHLSDTHIFTSLNSHKSDSKTQSCTGQIDPLSVRGGKGQGVWGRGRKRSFRGRVAMLIHFNKCRDKGSSLIREGESVCTDSFKVLYPRFSKTNLCHQNLGREWNWAWHLS